MKRLLVPIFVLILILYSLPVFGAPSYEVLRLSGESIENQRSGNIAGFKMMDSNRIEKRLEIDDTGIKYLTEKGIKLTVETNIMTLTVTTEAFKTKEWLEAVKSGDPVSIRLIIKRGSGTKVAEYFNEWYYNQIGLSRFGTSAWNLTGEILVAGVKKHEFNSFAAPLNIKVEYPVNESSNVFGENNLEMYVLNEQKEKWDYLGGSVDQEKNTISFDTKVPGLFIILSNEKPPQFSDIKGHWAESDIQFLMSNKVVQVEGSSKFYPNQEITRAEFAGFLVRLLQVADGGVNPFKDINSNHPYYQEIVSAVNAGLVNGISKDSFAPNKSITREEMAVMMTRALKYKNAAVETNEDNLTRFNDSDKVSLWAKEGVNVVSSAGLMNGKEVGKFSPKSFTTKGEAAAILHRLYNKTM